MAFPMVDISASGAGIRRRLRFRDRFRRLIARCSWTRCGWSSTSRFPNRSIYTVELSDADGGVRVQYPAVPPGPLSTRTCRGCKWPAAVAGVEFDVRMIPHRARFKRLENLILGTSPATTEGVAARLYLIAAILHGGLAYEQEVTGPAGPCGPASQRAAHGSPRRGLTITHDWGGLRLAFFLPSW